MKQVMNSVKSIGDERERAAVLRLELDYELVTLFDAMIEQDEELKIISKQKLEGIRQELLKLQVF